jgi:putative redox protein
MEKTILEASIGRELYKTNLKTIHHTFLGDEPKVLGGGDTGPSPYEFILAGLATCTAATVRMYADRKGWDFERLDISLSLEIEKTSNGQKTIITRKMKFVGGLTDEQIARLSEIGHKCPVHKMLSNEIVIE